MLVVTMPFTIERRTVHIEKLVIETLTIKDHRSTSCTVDGNVVVTFEAKKRRHLPCSKCGTRSPRHDRLPKRTWLHVPLWGIASFLVYRPWRVRCPRCGIKREALPWAIGKARMTRALVVTLATWAKRLPVETVAELFGVSWNTVYAAVREAVASGL
jgi:transposase